MILMLLLTKEINMEKCKPSLDRLFGKKAYFKSFSKLQDDRQNHFEINGDYRTKCISFRSNPNSLSVCIQVHSTKFWTCIFDRKIQSPSRQSPSTQCRNCRHYQCLGGRRESNPHGHWPGYGKKRVEGAARGQMKKDSKVSALAVIP